MLIHRSACWSWLALTGLCVGTSTGGGSPPFVVTGPGVDSNDFRVTTFASGPGFPMGMVLLEDNSLLVAVNQGVSFVSTIGHILRFVDENDDGVADGPGQPVASNVPGSQTGLAAAGHLVVSSSRPSSLVIFRSGALPSDPLFEQGRLLLTYPTGWSHRHSAVELRARPHETNAFDLIFQIGSQTNPDKATGTVALTNQSIPGASGRLEGDALYQITLLDHGTHVSATNIVQLATGLRNAAGFKLHPATDDLFIADNGIDGLVVIPEPLSVDELNVIRRAEIGDGIVEDFGFPNNYTEYRTGTVVGGGGIQPLVEFQPIPDPFTGAESEGPNQIAIAPPGFPAGLNSGVFITFHGQYALGGLDNEENPLVYADPVAGTYFHFIEGQQVGIGHLDGIVASSDSLFVADFVTTGNPFDGANAGVIYQIKAITPPIPPALTLETEGAQTTVRWDRGRLQQANSVAGPWTTLADAFSPHPLDLSTPSRFFRAAY